MDEASGEAEQDQSSPVIEKRVRKSATRKKAAKERGVSRQEKFTFGSKLALTMDDLKQFGAIASAINARNETLTKGRSEDIQQQAIVPIMRQIERNENLSKALDVICAIKRFDPNRSDPAEFNQKMTGLLGEHKRGGDASSSSESSESRSEVSIGSNTPPAVGEAEGEFQVVDEDSGYIGNVEMQEAQDNVSPSLFPQPPAFKKTTQSKPLPKIPSIIPVTDMSNVENSETGGETPQQTRKTLRNGNDILELGASKKQMIEKE